MLNCNGSYQPRLDQFMLIWPSISEAHISRSSYFICHTV